MAASLFTAGTWPQSKKERITVARQSDQRQLLIQHNNLMTNLSTLFAALAGNCVLTQTTLSIGTTVTLASSAVNVTINGVPVLVAAQTAQAFGALGTIPASTWGLIAVDVVAAGTLTFVSAAANYTTGYATEALALAANPAATASKARVGYLTILASASTFVVGTDALAGGTGGNPATTTNYYSIPSVYDTTQWTAFQVFNLSGSNETY